MIPMTPSSPACYRELEGAGEEGNYWPSVSPGVPLSTSGDEGAGTKVRKPYTITKQRERWTEEEHQKFLEALKLYGRAWRRIEEHIGTKTAVQIRSHAQKFFSKIERDVTAGQGAETGVAQVIDIPPPRPKRKPSHPYPRKAGRSFGKISEDECPLAAAGSISSSSGVSTANITEGCSKSNVWEQDDTAEACHQDVAKVCKDADATRPWGIPKSNNPANAGSSPVQPAVVAPNAGPQMINHTPVPIPAFPAAMPWARIFGGAMNPAMVSPAMMNPAMMSSAMMNPQGMMMPWGVASSAQGLENGGAVSAMAATIAAASAWWAMQGGMPPGVMHPALGAMYLGGGPPLAIPTPFLFPQCVPQEVIVAAGPSGDGKEVPTAHAVDDGQDIPSFNGNSRSSAMRRAERAQRVKELKARRMGSGSHLVSVSSDICASTSGGSGTNVTAGQVTTGNLLSESAVNSLLKGVSLPADLNKVKQVLHGFVRKEREAPADGGPLDDGDEKRKRLRGGRPTTDTVMGDGEEHPSTAGQGREARGGLHAHLEKVRSVSGSNSLPGKFTSIDVKGAYDETSPTDASCGSDNSDGAQTDGNGLIGGPSSDSSACGNAAEGKDRSGSSDGSSEGEATCKVDRQRESEKNGRSSLVPDAERKAEDKVARTLKQFTFSEFLPVCKDGDRCEKLEGSSRLPRTVSIDGEQRKEVTERGQIAFRALFNRDTLPRTFSPPPGLALGTGSKEILPSKQQPSSACNMNRSLSANAISCDTLELRSPLRTREGQDSAFNTWEHLRGTSSASKVDRCESGVSIPSSRPTKSLEDLQSLERRRNNRKGRSHTLANNWLQLAPTSSLDKDGDADEEDEEDESADSGADEGCKEQQKESFVCKLDLPIASQDNELHSDTDGPGITSLDLSSTVTSPTLFLSIDSTGLKNTAGSVPTRTVKYSGLGFVPYQRASTRVESLVEKL